MIYLALYKGKRDGKWYKTAVWTARLSDWAIRTFTRGKYSHCEIAVHLGKPTHINAIGWELPDNPNDPDVYACYSSSIRDGGVRLKTMPLPSEKWDLIALGDSDTLHAAVQFYFTQLKGKKYDYLGAMGVVLKTRQHRDKWFCSEFCAAVLGLPESWRFSPNDLAAIVQHKREWGVLLDVPQTTHS